MSIRKLIQSAAWALAACCLAAAPARAQEAEMDRIRQTIERNLEQGVRAPELAAGEWLNVGEPLSLARLRGKVVLLDFWTYCCINCQHVIPELKALEAKYPAELVVIGVHSAKFDNERDTENIRQSILRHEIAHPVVNDADFRIWRSYAVRAWPTLVLIAPDGRIALVVSGEGNGPVLDRAIRVLVERFGDRLDSAPLELSPETAETGLLRFPGKIHASDAGLAIADTGHNRILLADFDGRVTDVIGSGAAGSRDGRFEEAEFDHPQGVLRAGGVLYVADTENHLVRRVDVAARRVETIAGTGRQGGRIAGSAPALETPLNSPWDLAVDGSQLYLAMAGAHQIWTLDLERRTVSLLAGDGRENIRDGSLGSAQFAQPSGLSLRDGFLYVADSEVSAVRRIDLGRRRVETLVGEGLFEFGDRDGASRQARLAHGLGVHAADGVVYVADTYNHKIKKLDPARGQIETLSGTGEPGDRDGSSAEWYEPGGLWAHAGTLYVADTNNHAVKALDPASGRVRRIELVRPSVPAAPALETVDLPGVLLRSGGGRIELTAQLPPAHGYTPGQGLQVEWDTPEPGVSLDPVSAGSPDPSAEGPIGFDVKAAGLDQARLEGTVRVGYCTQTEPKLCKWKEFKIRVPVRFDESAPGTAPVAVGIPED